MEAEWYERVLAQAEKGGKIRRRQVDFSQVEADPGR
jgi:hypothetical protein